MFYNHNENGDIPPRLTGLMDIRSGDKLALTGCGGKTSLMYRLADENRDAPVLISTTTHIARPEPDRYDFISENGDVSANKGITLIFGGEQNGKLLPAPDDVLLRSHPLFDYTILECDGSRGLPLKGWESFEPITPDFVTATVGVCVIYPLGEILSEKNTLRLSRFCEITGAEIGKKVEMRHIAAMVSHSNGLFKRSRGKKILLINQIESKDAAVKARELAEALPKSFLRGVSRIISGSISQNQYEILWRGKTPDEH